MLHIIQTLYQTLIVLTSMNVETLATIGILTCKLHADVNFRVRVKNFEQLNTGNRYYTLTIPNSQLHHQTKK